MTWAGVGEHAGATTVCMHSACANPSISAHGSMQVLACAHVKALLTTRTFIDARGPI